MQTLYFVPCFTANSKGQLNWMKAHTRKKSVHKYKFSMKNHFHFSASLYHLSRDDDDNPQWQLSTELKR